MFLMFWRFKEFYLPLLLYPMGVPTITVAAQLRSSAFGGTLMLEALTENSNVYDGIDPLQYLERAATAAKRLAKMIEA